MFPRHRYNKMDWKLYSHLGLLFLKSFEGTTFCLQLWSSSYRYIFYRAIEILATQSEATMQNFDVDTTIQTKFLGNIFKKLSLRHITDASKLVGMIVRTKTLPLPVSYRYKRNTQLICMRTWSVIALFHLCLDSTAQSKIWIWLFDLKSNFWPIVVNERNTEVTVD